MTTERNLNLMVCRTHREGGPGPPLDAQPLGGSGRPMTMVPAEPYSDGWSPAADQVNLGYGGYVPYSQIYWIMF